MLHFPKLFQPTLTPARKGAWPLLTSSSLFPPIHFPLMQNSINRTSRFSCTLDVRRKPVWTYYISKKKQNPKPPQKYPLIQLHFQTPRRTERGTWDDPGWQLKAEPSSCQFLQAAFVITQRRARGSAGHRAGGASCLPELQGSVGHSPANSPPTSGQGDSPCPQGFWRPG